MKKLICAILSATVALSLAGCSFVSPQVALTINETEIPAGLYLIYQHQAYAEANDLKEDAEKDLLKQQIEGVDASQWIHSRTLDSVKRYVYVDKAFAESGFTFTEEEQTSMQTQADTWFTENEKMFAKNGIGKKSYDLFFLSSLKESKLLSDKFAKDEANVYDDAAIKKYTDENYAHVASLIMPITDELYQPLAEEDKAKVQEIAKALSESLKGGTDFTKELAKETLEKVFVITGHEMNDSVTDQYFTKDYLSESASSQYPEEMAKEMMEATEGTVTLTETNSIPVVWKRIPSFETDEDYDYYRPSILAEMQKKAFDEMVLAEIANYTVEENKAAISEYSLKKVKLK